MCPVWINNKRASGIKYNVQHVPTRGFIIDTSTKSRMACMMAFKLQNSKVARYTRFKTQSPWENIDCGTVCDVQIRDNNNRRNITCTHIKSLLAMNQHF